MPFGRKSPLEALALPGVILAYKYSQFRQRRREAASRRVTERELSALHHKIDKLLSKLEESEPDPPTSQEDECVICINARATMQTSPCGHRVVCRRCFVKTIQSAVAQRLLPLRCVICRARVNRLTSTSGTTYRIQESASSYSMGAKSWSSTASGVPASASAYSMGDAHSGQHSFNYPMRSNSASAGSGSGGSVGAHHHYPRSPNSRVAQSASLYSMSSNGSTSGISGMSHASNYSKTSSISSSGLYSSPTSPISPASTNSGYTPTTASILNNHLAPPQSSPATLSPSGSAASGSTASSPLSPREHHHSHRLGCPSGCAGAIPRKPLGSLSHSPTTSMSSSSGVSCGSFLPTTQTYPGRRYTKSRLVDLQNRLPPIKEFRSPAKVPHPSPVHVSNPRFRYASYTKSANETASLLCEPPSPPKRPLNIQVNSSVMVLAPPPLKAGGARISPLTSKNSLPKNAYQAPIGKDKKLLMSSKSNSKLAAATNGSNSSSSSSNNNKTLTSNSIKKLNHDANANPINPKATLASNHCSKMTQPQKQTSASNNNSNSSTNGGGNGSSGVGGGHASRALSLFSSSNHSEKADNKKNESVERKKKEEKLKLKAEKDARKEEKRLAKEEERLAKLIAKEEKKKGKKEAKELLLANDGNSKK